MKAGKRIFELRKLSKEEIISEYKDLVRKIRELHKEKARLNLKWNKYYYQKDWRKRNK